MYTISQHYIKDSFLSKCIQRGSSNLVKTLMDKCGLLKQYSTTNLFHNSPKLFQNSLPEPPARCNQKYCPESISKFYGKIFCTEFFIVNIQHLVYGFKIHSGFKAIKHPGRHSETQKAFRKTFPRCIY